MRTMHDSIDPYAIPQDAAMVAGYVDGEFGPDHAAFGQPGWSQDGWDRFPGAVKVRIAINAGTRDGQVGDVESGDMTAANAVGWAHYRRAAGVDPTIYTSLSNWATVRQAFEQAGEPEPHWWIADYDDLAVIPDGAVAKQYADSVLTGANYDLSIVADHWPGVDAATPPPAPPSPVVADDGVQRF